MQTELPVYDTPEDALRACVQALGGAKKVGPMLWPDKTIENAARTLLDCINPDRNEKLTLSQTLLIFREAKRIGFHAGMEWFAGEAEYRAIPVTKDEQIDQLATVISEASKTLAAAINKLDAIQNPKVRAA